MIEEWDSQKSEGQQKNHKIGVKAKDPPDEGL